MEGGEERGRWKGERDGRKGEREMEGRKGEGEMEGRRRGGKERGREGSKERVETIFNSVSDLSSNSLVPLPTLLRKMNL